MSNTTKTCHNRGIMTYRLDNVRNVLIPPSYLFTLPTIEKIINYLRSNVISPLRHNLNHRAYRPASETRSLGFKSRTREELYCTLYSKQVQLRNLDADNLHFFGKWVRSTAKTRRCRLFSRYTRARTYIHVRMSLNRFACRRVVYARRSISDSFIQNWTIAFFTSILIIIATMSWRC